MTGYLQDRQLTLALTGEIDHHGAMQLVQELQKRIELYLPLHCVLDFQDVTFMDSSGIAVIISAVRQMRQLGGRVTIRGAQDQPLRVMHAAGLSKIVEIEPRKKEAKGHETAK